MSKLSAEGAFNIAIKNASDGLLDAALEVIEEAAKNGKFSVYEIELKAMKKIGVEEIDRLVRDKLERDLTELGYRIHTYEPDAPYDTETKEVSWRK